MTNSTRIALASRPSGAPTAENFRHEAFELPELGDGQILVRVLWLSLDPYMRGRMDDAKSYAKPVGLGDTMEGGTVGEAGVVQLPQVVERHAEVVPHQCIVRAEPGRLAVGPLPASLRL